MGTVINGTWSILNLSLYVDGYSFRLWQPFAFAVLCALAYRFSRGKGS